MFSNKTQNQNQHYLTFTKARRKKRLDLEKAEVKALPLYGDAFPHVGSRAWRRGSAVRDPKGLTRQLLVNSTSPEQGVQQRPRLQHRYMKILPNIGNMQVTPPYSDSSGIAMLSYRGFFFPPFFVLCIIGLFQCVGTVFYSLGVMP